jgi:hypothetical protein
VSAAVPSTTSSTTSSWRFAVIGLVAVLAVGIGLAVGAFFMGSRAAAIGDGASYVPANTTFYAELRLEPSPGQDAALREFLGAFPEIEGLDLDRPLADQLAERFDEMLAGEDISITWSDDIASWFDGRVAIAMPELPLDDLTSGEIDPLDPSAPFPTPAGDAPVVVMLGVTDRAAAESAIDRILAEAEARGPIDVEETTHAGVTVNVVGGTEPGAWALLDDQLLLAPSADGLHAAIDAHADRASTLAEAEHLAALAAQLPEDWLAFVTYDMTEVVAASWDQMASMAPEAGDAFASLLEHQSFRGAVALTAGSDRLALDVAGEAPSGPFAVENADRGLADELPADTLYYGEGGNIGAALAGVIGPIKEAAAETPEGADGVAMIEAALGADLEDLVSWIEDGALSIGWDGSEAYGGLLLVPSDVEEADRRLGQLATFASLAAMDPQSGISVDEREVAGTEVTSISWQGTPLGPVDPMLPGPAGLVIEIAVTDDRALVGIGERFVEAVLTLDGGSLADEARFSDAVDDLGGAENAGVAWLDLAGVREALEEVAVPQLEGMEGDGSYERDIRPWLLPLDRLVQVSRLEGDLLVQRSVLLVE